MARRNLPQGGDAALAARLDELARPDRARCCASRPRWPTIRRFMAGYRYPRAEYDLPGMIETADERWALKVKGVRLVEQGGRAGLVREGTREAVEMP